MVSGESAGKILSFFSSGAVQVSRSNMFILVCARSLLCQVFIFKPVLFKPTNANITVRDELHKVAECEHFHNSV